MGVPKPWVVDERALIHGVLRDEDLLDIAAYVTPEDFAAEAHGAIWRVCQEAHKRGQPVTPLVVGQMLRRLLVDMPDKANDAAEYVEKLHAAPQEISPDEASHLAENIVRYATMRRSVEELEGLLSLARGNDQRFFGEVKRFGEGVGSLRRKETVVSWSDSITETLEELEAQQNGLLPPYVKTGIPSLDHQEVFRRGEMVVLAGRPSTGKCLAGSTLLVDPDTGEMVSIADAVARHQSGNGSMRVLSLDHSYKLTTVSPSAFVYNDIQPVFSVSLRSGRSISVTLTHPFLTVNGWKKLSDLSVGDWIATPRIVPVFGNDRMDDDDVALLAYIIGDGGTTGGSVKFTTASPIIEWDIRTRLSCKGVSMTVDTRDGQATTYRLVTPRGQHNPVIDLVEKHGVRGVLSKDKDIPASIYRAPKDQVALFLRCLFACDGCAYVRGNGQSIIAYCSASESLARGVQHLLLRFGIKAQLRRKTPLCAGKRFVAYEVEVMDSRDILEFADSIGIFSKEEDVDDVVRSVLSRRYQTNVDLVPVDVWEKIVAAKGRRTWREVYDALGKTHGYNIHVWKRSPRRETIGALGELLDNKELRNLAVSDVFWDKIVSIEPQGEGRVYDLTVDVLHNFVAADIIVHNTAFALQVALASARRQSPVLFASLEMRDKRLVRRALSAESGVPAGTIRRADMTAEQWNVIKIRAEEQRLWKMHTLSKGRVTYDQVLSEARRLKAGDDLALIVIDYFQIMRQAPKKGHDPLTTLQELSADIKNMAVDLDVCVLLLSQLNRVHAGHDGARPTIADLKATGALEQDADVVLLLSPDLREWEYAEWKNEKNRPVLLDLAKSRDGDVMDIPLTFFADNVRFGETSEYEHIVIPDGSEVSGVVSEDPAAPRISQDAINWERWA